MTLNRGVVVKPRATSTNWLSLGARVGALALLFAACMSAPERPRLRADAGEDDEGGSGGSEDEGGSGGGGKAGSGGSAGKGGSGGGGKAGSGGSAGSAGSGGSAGRDGGMGGSPDGGGARPEGGTSAVDWKEKVNLVLANCVFCHNDPTKRVNLQENGVYMRLVNATAAHAPSGCPTKVLVVPNNPMMSLLYLKVTGKMASTCGLQMPLKKPPITTMEQQVLLDWINAGAPPI
jgi:hypothetical protein